MKTDIWVRFGDIARGRCGMQSQYCSRYLMKESGDAYLGEGIRFRGEPARYHSILMHRDDADLFVHRVRTFRESRHCGWSGEE